MKRIILILALWLATMVLALTVAFGQTAVITGPAEAAAGYPVRFSAEGSTGTTFEWAALPLEATAGLSPDPKDPRSLAFSVPFEGDVVIILVVDRKVSAVHNLTLQEGEDGPDPPPPPPGVLARVVVVEETDSRTPEQAAVILSEGWRSRLKAANIPLSVTDQNVVNENKVTPPDLVESIKVAVALGLPAVVCLDGAGNVIGTHPLPTSDAGMVELLDRYEVE